jgi:hypothetical protein
LGDAHNLFHESNGNFFANRKKFKKTNTADKRKEIEKNKLYALEQNLVHKSLKEFFLNRGGRGGKK